LLDNLAAAWSHLDRARPRRQSEVPLLLLALEEWVRWALRVEDELDGLFGAAYPALRAERAGGPTLPGLRLIADLTERGGHPIAPLVVVTAGLPAIFYEVIWKAYADLPQRPEEPLGLEREQAYRR